MFKTYYPFFISLLLGTTVGISANGTLLPGIVGFLWLIMCFCCLLFIPVLIIETIIMRRFFKTETFGELIKINLDCNGLSKLVVFPIVFLASIFLFLLAGTLFLGNLIFALILPFAILLFTISYFISVQIEQWIVTKFLGNKYNQEMISQAVRSANKVSHMLLFIGIILGLNLLNKF